MLQTPLSQTPQEFAVAYETRQHLLAKSINSLLRTALHASLPNTTGTHYAIAHYER